MEQEVVSILRAVERYFVLTLAQESLTPDAAMGREDVLAKVQDMLEKVQKGSSLLRDNEPTPVIDEKVSCDQEDEGEMDDLYDDAATVQEQMREDSKDISSSSEVVIQEDYEVLDDNRKTDDALYEVDIENCQEVGKQSEEPVGDTKPVDGDPSDILENDLIEKVKSLQRLTPTEAKQGCLISGYLCKHKKKMFTKWHKRFCVIKDSFLFYFKSDTENKEKGVIILPFYSLSLESSTSKDCKYMFKLLPAAKGRDTYQFMAESALELEKWTGVLQLVCGKNLSKRSSDMLYEVTREIDQQNQTVESGSNENSAGEAIAPIMQPPDDQETYDLIDDPSKDQDMPKVDEGAIPEDIYEDIPAAAASEKVSVPVENPPATVLPLPSRVSTELPTTEFSVDNLYVGVYECQAEEQDELSFTEGDVIYILDKVDVNWWIGYLYGKIGLVPKSYIQEAF